MNYSKTKLTMPVLTVGGGGYIPILGDNVTMPTAIYGMKTLAQNVQGAAELVACRIGMKITNTNRKVKFCLMLKENTSDTE